MNCHYKLLITAVCLLVLIPAQAFGGSYTLSAHGSSTNGVDRDAAELAAYSQGNCSHCHEQHTSILSEEPDPKAPTANSGGPRPFALFARNFDSSATPGSYAITDNFCFSCHCPTGSTLQQTGTLTNSDYSETFGCAVADDDNILNQFNRTTFHDLQDIRVFGRGYSAMGWFTNDSNPCEACHNSHLAKRNNSDPDNESLAAISKPSDHGNLYGAIETMDDYADEYASPVCSSNREPADAGAASGSETPDYPGFCQDCHDTTNTIYSTRLGRNLRTVDWDSMNADKHGNAVDYDSNTALKYPYNDSIASYTGLVLSCLDCHEPHGSDNVFLLRRRVNGQTLGGTISTCDSRQWGWLCTTCHLGANDSATPPDWDQYSFDQYIPGLHHSDFADSPQGNDWGCIDCHSTVNPSPPLGETMACINCHYHGASVANDSDVRQTF